MEKLKLLLALIITNGVMLTSVALFGGIIYFAATSSTNNYQLVVNAFQTCEPLQVRLADKMIVLRLDNIQAYGHNEVVKRMINDAKMRKMPVVAGVIPNNIKSDEGLVKYLNKHECMLEIAMHGYDNLPVETNLGEVAEFKELSVSEVDAKTRKGLDELADIFEKKVITFIPPENELSEMAGYALIKNGIKVISSKGLKYFDYHSSLWNYQNKSLNPSENVIASCERRFTKFDVCVIMLHPQDVLHEEDDSVDEIRYKEYLKILDYFYIRNIPAITFEQLIAAKGR